MVDLTDKKKIFTRTTNCYYCKKECREGEYHRHGPGDLLHVCPECYNAIIKPREKKDGQES